VPEPSGALLGLFAGVGVLFMGRYGSLRWSKRCR